MRLNRIFLSCLGAVGFSLATEAHAVPCEPLTGTPYISKILMQNVRLSNDVGDYDTLTSTQIPRLYKIKPGCNAQGGRLYFTSVVGPTLIPAGTDNTNIGHREYFHMPGNDYVKINISGNVGGLLYTDIPMVAESNGCSTTTTAGCYDQPHTNGLHSGSEYYVNIMLKKKMIGNVYMPDTVVADYYAATTPNDPLTIPVTRLVFGGNIVVPESCAFDLGDVIQFKFGDLPASSFVESVVGQPLKGVTIQSKNMNMTCKGMLAGQLMSARVTAPSVQGNMVISDNPDVGFQIADENSRVLIPNTSTSLINLKLDSFLKSKLTLKAWPVSPTGNRPKAGPVTSMANVTLDFK